MATTPATAVRMAYAARASRWLSWRSASEPTGRPAMSVPAIWTAENRAALPGEPVIVTMASG